MDPYFNLRFDLHLSLVSVLAEAHCDHLFRRPTRVSKLAQHHYPDKWRKRVDRGSSFKSGATWTVEICLFVWKSFLPQSVIWTFPAGERDGRQKLSQHCVRKLRGQRTVAGTMTEGRTWIHIWRRAVSSESGFLSKSLTVGVGTARIS